MDGCMIWSSTDHVMCMHQKLHGVIGQHSAFLVIPGWLYVGFIYRISSGLDHVTKNKLSP